MAESVTQQIARLEAEIAALKAKHRPPLSANVVEEPRVTITTMAATPQPGTMPSESEVDQLLALVEQSGTLSRGATQEHGFRSSFVAALQFLTNVGRTDGVSAKNTAHQWALDGERFMGELSRSVNFTNGSLWAAALACGVPHQLGRQDRGIPARLGLAWDSTLPRAHSRWRQILQQGKIMPPIPVPDTLQSERAVPVIVHRNASVSGMT